MRPDNGAHDGVPGSCRFVAEISALVHAPRPCRGHAFRYRRAYVEPRSRSAYAVDVGSAGVRHAAHPSSAIEFIPRMAPTDAATPAPTVRPGSRSTFENFSSPPGDLLEPATAPVRNACRTRYRRRRRHHATPTRKYCCAPPASGPRGRRRRCNSRPRPPRSCRSRRLPRASAPPRRPSHAPNPPRGVLPGPRMPSRTPR